MSKNEALERLIEAERAQLSAFHRALKLMDRFTAKWLKDGGRSDSERGFRLSSGVAVVFAYDIGGGSFEVELRRETKAWQCEIRLKRATPEGSFIDTATAGPEMAVRRAIYLFNQHVRKAAKAGQPRPKKRVDGNGTPIPSVGWRGSAP